MIAPTTIWLLWPVLAHLALVFFLYAYLTYVRMRAVKNGETDYGCFVLGREEPIAVARVTRNLANQFELPVIFYLLVVLLLILNRASSLDVIAAWIFVIGRIIHTLVQTQTDNVPLRGKVFLINFLAVIALAAHVAFALLEQ